MESQRSVKVTHLGNCIDLQQVVLSFFGLNAAENSIAKKIRERVLDEHKLPLLLRGVHHASIESVIRYGTDDAWQEGCATYSIYAKRAREGKELQEAISEAVRFSAEDLRHFPYPPYAKIARVRWNSLVLVYDATDAVGPNWEGFPPGADEYQVPKGALLHIYHFNLLLGVVR